jgi:hypothetical protein
MTNYTNVAHWSAWKRYTSRITGITGLPGWRHVLMKWIERRKRKMKFSELVIKWENGWRGLARMRDRFHSINFDNDGINYVGAAEGLFLNGDWEIASTKPLEPKPATLSTGDMVNALEKNHNQKVKRTSNGYVYGLHESGTVECLEPGQHHWYSADIRDTWTLVPEPPKPVDFMTAVKAYAEGKTIVCEWKEQKFTYTPRKYDARLIDNNKNTIGYTEILEGYWFIREE